MWFSALTGFDEDAVPSVAEQFVIDGEFVTSRMNGRRMRCGRFETPSLGALRQAAARSGGSGPTTVCERVADAQALHRDPANAGALFQVASQFNTLEMIGPSVTPESGIDRYESDRTQGPACAVACGAGTIYRNYLVPLPGASRPGQSSDRQVDCAAELGAALGNERGERWQMQNGYLLPSPKGLDAVCAAITGASKQQRDDWRARLRIGMQWDTEVTLDGAGHAVTQAYCSALPVAYGSYKAARWEPFARLVLEAAYEATLCAASINATSTSNRRVFLTQLGGGAFGNRPAWILDAMERAIARHADRGLEISIVSFRQPDPGVAALLDALGRP